MLCLFCNHIYIQILTLTKIHNQMASVKVKFPASTISDREGTIFYQIIHDRKLRHINTDYHILSSEWDNKRNRLIMSQQSLRKSYLLSIRERIRWDIERLNKVIKKLENSERTYTVEEISEEFNYYANKYSLFNYMEEMIIQLKQTGNRRTSETYSSTLNSFKKFRRDEDIMLDCISSSLMSEYEAWLRLRGIVPNSISFYTRILRAVYNRAVDDGVVQNRYPFRHVYTGQDKTSKRALSLQIIKKIKTLNLTLMPSLDFARDMFIMSFMLRGMSFIDMVYLRKTDLKNGYVTYCRRKTGQRLMIEWTEEMQEILDKYPENPTIYLLPIIKNPESSEWYTYRNVGYNINYNLKRIAQMIGLNIPLTLYVARHSWASVAKAKGIPLKIISEGMGHNSETTTQIYLASLDNSVIDRANAIILKSL